MATQTGPSLQPTNAKAKSFGQIAQKTPPDIVHWLAAERLIGSADLRNRSLLHCHLLKIAPLQAPLPEPRRRVAAWESPEGTHGFPVRSSM
jgi:hypothetical protein